MKNLWGGQAVTHTFQKHGVGGIIQVNMIQSKECNATLLKLYIYLEKEKKLSGA